MNAITGYFGRRLAVVATSVAAASVLAGGEAGEQTIVDPVGHTVEVSPIEVRLVAESRDTSRDLNPAYLMPAVEADNAQGAA